QSYFSLYNAPPTPSIYTLSLHDALPILCAYTRYRRLNMLRMRAGKVLGKGTPMREGNMVSLSTFDCIHAMRCSMYSGAGKRRQRSEEHTSELQSPCNLVCRLLLEKKKKQ